MDRKDVSFLKSLDNERNKFYYVRITVLDKFNKAIKSIEGRVLPGSSISINGNSSLRRTCNINLIAEDAENDLTNIENFLSINKKIKIFLGLEKQIDYSKDVYYYANKEELYPSQKDLNEGVSPFSGGFPPQGEKNKIYVDRKTLTYWVWSGKSYQQIKSMYEYQPETTWFPLGVYVITQPSISHTLGGCNISLSCKDKMCLLNGDMGGTLPASVTFDSYDQVIGELECSKDPREDEDLEVNDYTIYSYNDKYYTWDRQYGWKEYDSLPTIDGESIGGTVSCPQLVYDIILTSVANYGGEPIENIIINDVQKEIKQIVRYTGSSTLYLNPNTGVYTTDELYLTDSKDWKSFSYGEEIGYEYTDFTYPGELITGLGDNVCTVLDKIVNTLFGNYEYFYDIDGNFVFQEKRNYLNTSYNPTEVEAGTQKYYLDNNKIVNLENNSLRLIGEENYRLDYYADQKSIYTFEEGVGLISSYSNALNYSNIKNDFHIWGKSSDDKIIHYHLAIKDKPTVMQQYKVVFLKDEDGKYNGKIRLANSDDLKKHQGESGCEWFYYTPCDWRAELYLQGLETAQKGGRPDIYQQELLDLFDGIYEWGYYYKDEEGNEKWSYDIKDEKDVTGRKCGRFKHEVDYPNNLIYFIDYLEPSDKLYGITIDDIGTKIEAYQSDSVVTMYNNDIPDYIIISDEMEYDYRDKIMDSCAKQGQKTSLVEEELYKDFSLGSMGVTAQEAMRDLLYRFTSYNESISITSVPIYYLDVNKRITVKDKKSGINGDYIINNITLPLSAESTMTISASRALERF